MPRTLASCLLIATIAPMRVAAAQCAVPNQEASAVHVVTPAYPREAANKAFEGVVTVRVTIGANGSVTAASVLKSAGSAAQRYVDQVQHDLVVLMPEKQTEISELRKNLVVTGEFNAATARSAWSTVMFLTASRLQRGTAAARSFQVGSAAAQTIHNAEVFQDPRSDALFRRPSCASRRGCARRRFDLGIERRHRLGYGIEYS